MFWPTTKRLDILKHVLVSLLFVSFHLFSVKISHGVAHLHCHITLLQQQGDGDGLHRRHPFEAHLGNKALRALTKGGGQCKSKRLVFQYGYVYNYIFGIYNVFLVDSRATYCIHFLCNMHIYNRFPVYKKSRTPKHRGCRLRHLQRRPISRSRHGEEAVKSNRRKS